jgi:hypothetical protein
MIMGDEEAAGQQPADDEKQAGTAGSIYGGDSGPAQPGADDPDNTASTDSPEPDDDDDDSPPDDGSIYGG